MRKRRYEPKGTVELRISLTPEEYEELWKVKGDRTWKQMLTTHLKEDKTLDDINDKFEALQAKMIQTKVPESWYSVLDIMRVMTIGIYHTKNGKFAEAVLGMLEKALKEKREKERRK